MTTPPAVYGQFGQTLAFAERTLTATLREHLAQRDTRPGDLESTPSIWSRPGAPACPARRSAATSRARPTSTPTPPASCLPGSKPRD